LIGIVDPPCDKGIAAIFLTQAFGSCNFEAALFWLPLPPLEGEDKGEGWLRVNTLTLALSHRERENPQSE
jgi:hypothetical protein